MGVFMLRVNPQLTGVPIIGKMVSMSAYEYLLCLESTEYGLYLRNYQGITWLVTRALRLGVASCAFIRNICAEGVVTIKTLNWGCMPASGENIYTIVGFGVYASSRFTPINCAYVMLALISVP